MQAGDFRNIPAIKEAPAPIKLEYVDGSDDVSSRELVANYKITNEGKEPLQVGEIGTAGVRFRNPDIYTTKQEYPDYLLAERGLSLSDDAPIQPRETKDIIVRAQDQRWDREGLSGFAYDVDSSFAGVLFLLSPSGTRYPVEVGGAVQSNFPDADESLQEDTTQKQATDRTVKIYYATNRAADAQSRIINYTGDRADKLSFGIMQVRVPNNHHPGNVELDRKFINIQFE